IRTQAEQVVRNVLGNGVKFTGAAAAPAIDVRAEDRGDVVEWAVRDNGIGIDPPYHAKIFEVFQQLDDIDTEGTGVALALVKKIVESNGGRGSVGSEKGRGARVSFSRPEAPGPVPPACRFSAPTPWSAPQPADRGRRH